MNMLVKNELDDLAARIRAAFDRRENDRTNMAVDTMELGAALLQAREHFKADVAFGHWCDEVNLPIPKDERMALIAFAREPERARLVLLNTKSGSIQMIYRNEFRIRSSTKPRKPKIDKESPKTDAALAAYDELKAAGIEPTREQVAQKAGVSGMPAQLAINLRKAEEGSAKEGADVAELPKTAKEKAEAAVRKIQKKLELEFDHRLQVAVQRHVNEFILPMYAEKLAMADRIMAVNKKPFSIPEYRKLLAALHPDSSSVEARTEMFQIVKERELLLRPAEKDRPLSGDLPKTIEELLARRRKR